jgi:amino acid transporter
MTNTKRIRRAATVMLGVIIIIFLSSIIREIKVAINIIPAIEWDMFLIITYIIGSLFLIVLMVTGICLLSSIRKDESPFNKKNVLRLKIIAVLMIAIEPYMALTNFIFFRFLHDGSDVGTMSNGGFILVSGLVVYSIALVFDYGIALQTQVDETL